MKAFIFSILTLVLMTQVSFATTNVDTECPDSETVRPIREFP